ncbi:hypothetical protein GGQ68_003588 [Sagittula marina]|uniref:Uncharacterized protein n=1 Tax=Sagittula marina TaxID=943940 RepID=A0A7W6GTX9_9RHOB|nr:hypothetical protein [Sagittula marina]
MSRRRSIACISIFGRVLAAVRPLITPLRKKINSRRLPRAAECVCVALLQGASLSRQHLDVQTIHLGGTAHGFGASSRLPWIDNMRFK